MAAIDSLIGAMVQRGAHGITLESGQPSRLFSAGGVASGAVLEQAQLQEMLSEIVPPSLSGLLAQDGQFNFPYAAPSGPVSILVERRGLATRASISPAVAAPSDAPARPVEWNPGAAASQSSYAPQNYGSPQAPPPYGSQPYGSQPQAPIGAPIPLAYGGPPAAPMDARPSVGCLPALGVNFVYIFSLNIVTRNLGFWVSMVITFLIAIAVLIDAQKLDVRKGKLKGVADLAPWSWFFLCLVLSGIGVPYYVLARPLYARIKDAEDSGRTPYSQ